jgi:hypothetical protein
VTPPQADFGKIPALNLHVAELTAKPFFTRESTVSGFWSECTVIKYPFLGKLLESDQSAKD